MDRTSYLSSLIGRPWAAQGQGPDSYSCWALAVEIEARLWSRDLPDVAVPETPTLRWIIDTFARHPERGRWAECALPHGLVTAEDGALALMARADRPAHVGVWLAPEGGIIHADPAAGVVFEPPALLRARGWGRLRYFEPRD